MCLISKLWKNELKEVSFAINFVLDSVFQCCISYRKNDAEFILIETQASRLNKEWTGFYKSLKPNSFGRYVALCAHCDVTFEGRSDNLFNHKLKCTKKDKWPPEHLTSLKRPAEQSKQQSITKFTKPDRLDPEILAEKFLKAMISSSVPLSFTDDPYLKDFLSYAGVQLPSRSLLRLRTLPKILVEVQTTQKELIRLAEYINVVLDGWTDVSGIYYMAVILVFNGTCEYIGNLEMEDLRQDAPAISDALIDLISNYVPDLKQIVSVVSDSAPVMRLAKQKVTQKIPHIIAIPCVLHIFNLIIKETVHSDSMIVWQKSAQDIASYFRRSHYWSKKIMDWGKANKTSGVVKIHCETRWFSFFEMSRSICSKESWFKENFGVDVSGLANRKLIPVKVRNIISDDSIFSSLGQLNKIFEKIESTAKALESDRASIIDLWPAFIDLYRHYLNLLLQIPDKFKPIIENLLRAIDKKTSVLHEDIYILAFF